MRRVSRWLTLVGWLAVCLSIAPSAYGTHARPKGATPMRMSLVPAYAACAAPNRTHAPPLAFPSCTPPAQTSGQATVGTPDALGGAANAVSHLRLSTREGVPGPPDTADILLNVAINDARCVPTGASCGVANTSGPADYSGEMRFSFTFRLTDHVPGTAGAQAITVEDFRMEGAWACAQSESTSAGSTCNLTTSLEAFFPGTVAETQRAIWELDGVRISDGGPDGDADTAADDTVFLRPGVFIP